MSISLTTQQGVKRPAPDVPPEAFVAANRIHVKGGSLFEDEYLVVHPRELDPNNEAALRAKLDLTYDLYSPSFFEDKKRHSIARQFSELVPVAPQTQQQKLQQDIARQQHGAASPTEQAVIDRASPMASMLRETNAADGHDPVGMEQLKNGLAVYLLCREALTRHGYFEKLTDYVTKDGSPEQVMHGLADKLGLHPREMREVAARGGVAEVGKALGLEPAFIAEVAGLVGHMSRHDFSMNMLENWQTARPHAPEGARLEDKIQAGKAIRVTRSIGELRQKARGIYDVPQAISKEENRVADALRLVTPVERALMFALGYEICHTPEITADNIAFHKSIYGLHRKTANDLRDARGTYRVYFSGKGSEKDSLRTLRHEITHNLWPNAFTDTDITHTDALVQFDQQHHAALKEITSNYKPQLEQLIAAYHAAPDDNARQQVQAFADTQTEALGIKIGMVLPLLQGADQLSWMVSEAHDRLNIDGAFYDRTGYHEPSARLREVISRYAELRDVEYHEQPQMQALLGFVSPGMTKVFDDIYLPLLERVYEQVVAGQEKPGIAARQEQQALAAVPANAISTHAARSERLALPAASLAAGSPA